MAIIASVCLFGIVEPATSAQLTVVLQKTPNDMEPLKEPTRIRVDDRASVTVHIVNLSPLDLCSLGARTSTPTVEVNPIESLVGTIAALGAFGAGGGAKMSDVVSSSVRFAAPPPPEPMFSDPVYLRFQTFSSGFDADTNGIVSGQKSDQGNLDNTAPKALLDYLKADYRGTNWQSFDPESDSKLAVVRGLALNSLLSIGKAANAQAMLDQMTALAADLHKRFDLFTAGTTPPLARPTPAVRDELFIIDKKVAEGKASMAVIADNNTTLKASQVALKAAYASLKKVHDDFMIRKGTLHTVGELAPGPGSILYQDLVLGTDRKTTLTNTVACVSSADPTKNTTNQISLQVLYQDVPHWSASAGLLATFNEKRIFGITNVNAPGTAAGYNQYFALTDRSQAQVLPMVYLNYRPPFLPYASWWGGSTNEDERIITGGLSAGFGINPNSGTAQPEYFIGTFFGINKLMIHPGIHYGREQSLGGGFVEGEMVPSGLTTAPVNWKYRAAFSIGFSVRVAPY